MLHCWPQPPHAEHLVADRSAGEEVRPRFGLAAFELLGHHIENRAAYYQILRESLAPAGRLAIVDFRKDAALEAGPPLEMRLDRKDLESELSQAGFRLVEEHDLLRDQYFVVYSVVE